MLKQIREIARKKIEEIEKKMNETEKIEREIINKIIELEKTKIETERINKIEKSKSRNRKTRKNWKPWKKKERLKIKLAVERPEELKENKNNKTFHRKN